MGSSGEGEAVGAAGASVEGVAVLRAAGRAVGWVPGRVPCGGLGGSVVRSAGGTGVMGVGGAGVSRGGAAGGAGSSGGVGSPAQAARRARARRTSGNRRRAGGSVEAGIMARGCRRGS